MKIFTNPDYNFLRWKWHAIILSLIVIGAGVAAIAVRGLPLGIDFSGGTLVIVQFEQPVTEDEVRNAVAAAIPGEEVVQQYGDAAARQILIRLAQTGEEQGADLQIRARETV